MLLPCIEVGGINTKIGSTVPHTLLCRPRSGADRAFPCAGTKAMGPFIVSTIWYLSTQATEINRDNRISTATRATKSIQLQRPAIVFIGIASAKCCRSEMIYYRNNNKQQLSKVKKGTISHQCSYRGLSHQPIQPQRLCLL